MILRVELEGDFSDIPLSRCHGVRSLALCASRSESSTVFGDTVARGALRYGNFRMQIPIDWGWFQEVLYQSMTESFTSGR